MISNFNINDAKKWIIHFNNSNSNSNSSSLQSNYKVRLLCFHWVGGNGNYFKIWNKYFNNYQIDLYSVMLPGRMGRSKESNISNIYEIIEYLLLSLEKLSFLESNQPPLVFFGHSYGGIIAFELANLLYSRKQYSISHLIISSTNNPQVLTNITLSNNSNKYHLLSDNNLLQEITRYGGIPTGIHPDILQYMLPIIRSDYHGLESYQYQFQNQLNNNETNENENLQYPGYITVFGSDEDSSNVTYESLNGWNEYCKDKSKYSIHLFHSRSHFYFMESNLTELVLERIRIICEQFE